MTQRWGLPPNEPFVLVCRYRGGLEFGMLLWVDEEWLPFQGPLTPAVADSLAARFRTS
jgi:hypothetical protein